jgi:hypothetical protein
MIFSADYFFSFCFLGLHGFSRVFGVVVEVVGWDFGEQLNSSLSTLSLTSPLAEAAEKRLLSLSCQRFFDSIIHHLNHLPPKLGSSLNSFFRASFRVLFSFVCSTNKVPLLGVLST